MLRYILTIAIENKEPLTPTELKTLQAKLKEDMKVMGIEFKEMVMENEQHSDIKSTI